MRSVTNFLAGFALGSLIGFGVVLLVAPYSGEELRSRMQTEVARIQGEVKEAAATRRIELEQQLSSLREPRPPSTM